MGKFTFPPVDLLFTCLGPVLVLLDIVLDIVTVVNFYQEKDYIPLSLLVLFLLGSSVLVQAFSLLWYSYDDFARLTRAESCLSVSQLKLLHVLQLGIYFRHAGVVETSFKGYWLGVTEAKNYAVLLGNDLNLLRIIETFSESCPQFVLMLTIFLRRGKLDLVTVLKALASALAIACSMTMSLCGVRSFQRDKQKQPVVSSLVYFLCNLLLISSRLTALALFASVLPCFIFTHFFCSWIILFFVAWRSKTDLMDSPCGEWLYRATVGIIWYFSWFNVVGGKTRNRTLLYHGYILLDISLLCGLWYWKMSTKQHSFQISHVHSIITAVIVVAVYTLGLFVKIIYYKFYHPNLTQEEMIGGETASDKPESTESRCLSGSAVTK